MVGLVLGSAAFAMVSPAEAKKTSSSSTETDPFEGVADIIACGIAEFDSVFTEAGRLQKEMKTSYQNVKDAKTNVNTVLGVATDAPVATALADLQAKAAGKLKVVMNGTTPKLEAKDAIPDNVQKGLDAVNNLVDIGKKTADSVLAMKDKVVALGQQAAGFPMKVPTMLGSLSADQVKTTSKIVGDNVKSIKAMPGQIESISSQVTSIFNDIKTAFGG
jgi:hypothetical protein